MGRGGRRRRVDAHRWMPSPVRSHATHNRRRSQAGIQAGTRHSFPLSSSSMMPVCVRVLGVCVWCVAVGWSRAMVSCFPLLLPQCARKAAFLFCGPQDTQPHPTHAHTHTHHTLTQAHSKPAGKGRLASCTPPASRVPSFPPCACAPLPHCSVEHRASCCLLSKPLVNDP